MSEEIDVISVFRRKTVRPVKFKYAGRVHVVARVLYTWVTREGSFPVHHFSLVTEDGNQYRLELNTHHMGWSISEVDEPVAER